MTQKIGILTAGGLAPCLSAAVARLIERYTEITPEIAIICYQYGYQGLLKGDKIEVTAELRDKAPALYQFGGSPIGNSRVKLTNVKDCIKRGLIQEGQDPRKVAADQLVRDGITILHTIGGDDTNTAAADLAQFLKKNNYNLTVIGLPKTVDNDVYPIKQSLGAITATDEGARFFENIVAEQSANPRMLIIHEVMGRHCGWLTAATAKAYHDSLQNKEFVKEIGLDLRKFDLHGIYIPEMTIDIQAEAKRLKALMDTIGNINLFISEGAGVDSIIQEMEHAGEFVPRDAFGHVKLDAINPGQWFGKQFSKMIQAEKILVQKSGYFARSAPSNPEDLALIKQCVDKAVTCALEGRSGVIGHDEDHHNELRLIEFERIKGGKPFDMTTFWFQDLLFKIGQNTRKEAKMI